MALPAELNCGICKGVCTSPVRLTGEEHPTLCSFVYDRACIERWLEINPTCFCTRPVTHIVLQDGSIVAIEPITEAMIRSAVERHDADFFRDKVFLPKLLVFAAKELVRAEQFDLAKVLFDKMERNTRNQLADSLVMECLVRTSIGVVPDAFDRGLRRYEAFQNMGFLSSIHLTFLHMRLLEYVLHMRLFSVLPAVLSINPPISDDILHGLLPILAPKNDRDRILLESNAEHLTRIKEGGQRGNFLNFIREFIVWRVGEHDVENRNVASLWAMNLAINFGHFELIEAIINEAPAGKDLIIRAVEFVLSSNHKSEEIFKAIEKLIGISLDPDFVRCEVVQFLINGPVDRLNRFKWFLPSQSSNPLILICMQHFYRCTASFISAELVITNGNNIHVDSANVKRETFLNYARVHRVLWPCSIEIAIANGWDVELKALLDLQPDLLLSARRLAIEYNQIDLVETLMRESGDRRQAIASALKQRRFSNACRLACRGCAENATWIAGAVAAVALVAASITKMNS